MRIVLGGYRVYTVEAGDGGVCRIVEGITRCEY
jgi:hypothetical protein